MTEVTEDDCISCGEEQEGPLSFGVQGDPNPSPESAKAIETIIEAAYEQMKEEEEPECPNSERPCGHHCNCSWIHDHCHWCGKDFGCEYCGKA